MSDIGRKTGITFAFAFAAMIGTGPALADKPDWAGGGKHERKAAESKGGSKGDKSDRSDRSDRSDHRNDRNEARKGGGDRDRDDHRGDRGDRDDHHSRTEHRDGPRVGAYFNDRHRVLVREYYVEQYRGGHCPPGLAKKRNGCMPPGLAKKWRKGYALPRDVVYYDPPASIVIELGAPPALHRYVRVGADILLIAIGTGLVVDAIEDLSRM